MPPTVTNWFHFVHYLYRPLYLDSIYSYIVECLHAVQEGNERRPRWKSPRQSNGRPGKSVCFYAKCGKFTFEKAAQS